MIEGVITMEGFPSDREAYLLARIERLEELVVAMHERHGSHQRMRQLDVELYNRSTSTCGNDHPVDLGERMEEIRRLGRFGEPQ